MNENTRTNDAVVGFLLGAVVGAGVALLLAPASGRDTRRKIGDTARRLGDEANGKLGEIKETVGSRASEIKDAVAGRAAEIKDAVVGRAAEIKGNVEEAVETGRAAASNAAASKR